jgi:hypothetical protein
MRAFLTAMLCLALGLSFGLPGLAQTSDTDPASKEDVEIYLRTMHSHDTMLRTMEAMLKPMHQMLHEQFARDGKKPPVDFERRYNKMMDELMKGMPFDEMTQSVVPIYQKHFTKGDIDHLNAFYSSPTGQKVLEEMPAITGESMQAMMPVMRKYMDESKDRMQQEVKQMENDAPRADPNPPAQP